MYLIYMEREMSLVLFPHIIEENGFGSEKLVDERFSLCYIKLTMDRSFFLPSFCVSGQNPACVLWVCGTWGSKKDCEIIIWR